jgi:hypothetical protein
LIGGEPTLYIDRIRVFVDLMPYVTISSNGLRALPLEGFERVAVALTLFGGGPLDDELRGNRPDGRRDSGLFERMLANYRHDRRATFIYALTSESVDYLEKVVERVRENGNHVSFNHYSRYGAERARLPRGTIGKLVDEALRVREKFPETVVSHPYFIRTLLSGESHWGSFGYQVCPSISVDHSEHRDRLRNGNPVLRLFNSYAADGKTINFCCTSGHCEDCCDSQAIQSWLLVSLSKFLYGIEGVEEWIDLAESYWRQFVWSPFHPARLEVDSAVDRPQVHNAVH